MTFGWLVASCDLKWEGIDLVPGLVRRESTFGRFALRGTGVPHLGTLGKCRVFRAVFRDLITVPEEIRDQGVARALAVQFDPECECTVADGTSWWIVDSELLRWACADGDRVMFRQVEAGWPSALVPPDLMACTGKDGRSVAHCLAARDGTVPSGTGTLRDWSGNTVDRTAAVCRRISARKAKL